MEESTEKCEVNNTVNNNIELEDLPNHVIHQIMHLLPYEEAVKFSVLSKSFYSSWLSFPTLNFSYKSSSLEDLLYENQTFFDIVQKTLQLRSPYIKGSLHKLSLSYINTSCIFPYFSFKRGIFNNSHHYPKVFDVLLNFSIKHNVKELSIIETDDHLVFDQRDMGNIVVNVNYDSIRPLFSSQFLTLLKLTWIRVSSVDAFITCPKLKELLFKCCDGFQTIKVSSSSSLKKIEVKCCRGLKAIQILKGESLHSFKFEGHRYDELQQCTLDISDCLALRVLKLTRATTITDEWMNQTIRGLCCLEHLEIRNCNMLEKMQFENYNLKKLSLCNCLELNEVVVNVPNLLEFYYRGSLWHYSMFVLSANCKVSITLPFGISASDLMLVNRFLSSCNQFKDLSLSCHRFEDMIVSKHNMHIGNLSSLYDLRHLKLEASDDPLPSGQTLTRVLKTLFQLMSKPQTIILYSQSTKTTSILKFKYGKKMKKVGGCCYNIPIKCWRHYEVEIEFQGFSESERKYLKKFFAQQLRYYGIYINS